jgi:hypothetical protein
MILVQSPVKNEKKIYGTIVALLGMSAWKGKFELFLCLSTTDCFLQFMVSPTIPRINNREVSAKRAP